MLCRWAEHAYNITNVTRVEFEPAAHGPYSEDTPDLDLHMRVTVHSDDWRLPEQAHRDFEEPYTTGLIKTSSPSPPKAQPGRQRMIFRRKARGAPSFDEVAVLVARGRGVGSFTTGSPIEFRLADGRTATVLIHPDCCTDFWDEALHVEEAKWILEVMQADLNEHGYALPHLGGEWPPYGFVDADDRDKEWCRFSNELYLKLLGIAGIPSDALWRLPAK